MITSLERDLITIVRERAGPFGRAAEQLGRITNQFEPGTPVYDHVVEHARAMVHAVHTRDDIDAVLQFLDDGLVEHLPDGPRQEFIRCKIAIELSHEPLSVEAFKEGFAMGTGEQIPDPREIT